MSGPSPVPAGEGFLLGVTRSCLGELRARHVRNAEGRPELADERVRRRFARLEAGDLRLKAFGAPGADGLLRKLVLFGEIQHG